MRRKQQINHEELVIQRVSDLIKCYNCIVNAKIKICFYDREYYLCRNCANKLLKNLK